MGKLSKKIPRHDGSAWAVHEVRPAVQDGVIFQCSPQTPPMTRQPEYRIYKRESLQWEQAVTIRFARVLGSSTLPESIRLMGMRQKWQHQPDCGMMDAPSEGRKGVRHRLAVTRLPDIDVRGHTVGVFFYQYPIVLRLFVSRARHHIIFGGWIKNIPVSMDYSYVHARAVTCVGRREMQTVKALLKGGGCARKCNKLQGCSRDATYF